MPALLTFLLGCAAQSPEDGCSTAYADGFDVGFSQGEACYAVEVTVTCTDADVDYCNFAQAYDYCFNVAYLDGLRAGEEAVNSCERSTATCDVDLGQCVGG